MRDGEMVIQNAGAVVEAVVGSLAVKKTYRQQERVWDNDHEQQLRL
jgi:hypothetical protein